MEQIFHQIVTFLDGSWSRFSTLDLVLLAINCMILITAKPLMARFGEHSERAGKNLDLLRAGTLLIVLFLIFYNIVLPHEEHSYVTRLLGVVLVMYVGYLATYLSNNFIKRRFGRRRELGGEVFVAETYNSRLLALVAGAVMFALTLVAIIEVLGFEDLLHASGVFGVIGVMLALTQSSWAPDLISGLIILNNRLLEEGDVVEIGEDGGLIAMVFRTKMFHTDLLDIARNHRVLIQNSRLRGMTIRNLSRFASAKGLRERLLLNIGYEVGVKPIRRMVDQAFEQLRKESGLPVEFAHGYELHPVEAADYAVTWALSYYTKEPRVLLTTRCRVVAALIEAAAEHGIQLATPMLVSAPRGAAPVPPPFAQDTTARESGG